MSAQPTLSLDEPLWTLRAFDESTDADLRYLLGIAYCRTHAGRRAGASRAGGSRNDREREAGSTTDADTVAKQRAFLESMRPVWDWLLANATTTLAVDPEKPSIIWGWLITSESNVVHAVGVKRSIVQAKLAVDLVTDMLGERLKRHQVCSLELPQFRGRRRDGTYPPDAIGIERPREWSLDPTWLLTRMREARAA